MIAVLSSLLLASAVQVPDRADEARILEPITVTGRRVANVQPATTFAATATSLRFDPVVDLQARGLPEGQADVTVRGGLFENTGFRLGAVTIFDPQTGHYSVDNPLDPAMLSQADVLTDFDHGLNTFNATVATINYGFRTIRDGGRLTAGVGSDSLRYASVSASLARDIDGGTIGGTISASGSSGDGTLPYGDHDFKRFSAHLQWTGDHGESNLLLGYHDKFFGWPGAYTGFASLPETDHSKLGLVLLDHRWTDRRGWWEIGTAYRQLDDDYDFDRRTVESGTPGAFEHLTRAFVIGLSGLQHIAGLDWRLSSQFSTDRLVRSTDLTNGSFNSRSYLAVSIAPEKRWALSSGATLSLSAGLKADWSNRDEDALAPLFSISLEQPSGSGTSRYSLDYTRTTQLPGYTALNSPPRGLFGGNPGLGREYADTLTLAYTHESDDWMLRGAVFRREDEALVDWTYLQGAPFLRQANPVDLDVNGFEAVLNWRLDTLELSGGYTWLNKDADYGDALVDASYYALNFARHRFTLSLIYTPVSRLEIRFDNEYRRQQENSLRSGSDTAYIGALSLSWLPEWSPRTRLSLIADNVTDSDFQEFPGTPPIGRQVSLGLGLDW